MPIPARLIDSRAPAHSLGLARRTLEPPMFTFSRLTHSLILVAAGAVAWTACPAPAQPDSPERLREDIRRMVTQARDRVFPALVNISVITVNYSGGKESKGGGVGSGTIISPEGYVVTNHHVVENGMKFRVTLADKQEVAATLVGDDPLTDLAVLRIDAGELREGTRLPSASWGESEALQVGDYVMAMGSPFSLSRTVTLGIVSNTERVFTGSGDEVEEQQFEGGQRTGLFTRWVQHDAAINPGNSGGPLVNLHGEVIGVNTLGGSQMGFAIPSSLARPVAESLIARGEVVRSYIGVQFKSIKRSDFTEGVLVNSVVKDGPADRAGLRAGDLVLSMDGTAVTARFPEEIPALARTIADLPPGSPVKVTYRRDGLSVDAVITTEKLLKDRGDESALRLWGFSAMQITEKMAKDRLLDSTLGALVTGIRGGGPAEVAEPQVTWGDVIRTIDGQAVTSLEDLLARYKEIMSREPVPEFVMVGFDRQGKSQVTLLKPRPDKKEDPPREIPKPWIGVATQPVLRDLAAKLGHPGQLGFRVSRVYPGTLAASAGLRVGDVIVGVNGEAASPRTMQDAGLFQRRVRQLPIDQPAVLTVIRDGQRTDIPVSLERTRIGPDEALRDHNKDFEVSVRELTFFDRDDFRWDEGVAGVIVENVERAGWAGLAGVLPGDLLQKIDGVEVKDIPGWRRALDDIAKRQPAKVTIVVRRWNRTFYLFAEPEWKPVVKEEAAPAK
jgi:serine protease Do